MKLLNKSIHFNLNGIDKRLPIRHDLDPESKQKRKTMYTQERDILMKLAEDRGEGKRISEYCQAVVEEKDEKISFSWNFTADIDYDEFPKEISNCLMLA